MQDMSSKKILVHSFVTDTYLPWAELFLEALRVQQGHTFDVRIDVYSVAEKDQSLLRNIYPGVEIRDLGDGYEEFAKEQSVSMHTVYKWREQITKGETTEENFPFKLFISVDKRYRQLQEVLATARKQGYDFVIHSDIDIYIRKPLDPMLALMHAYDVGLYFRPSAKEHWVKTLGAFIVLKTSDGAEKYIQQWMREIDAVSKKDRWRGFGQSTQYFAAKKSAQTRFADFSTVEGAPQYSKTFNPQADMWLNSNSFVFGAGKLGVDIARRRSWLDLKQSLPRFTLITKSQIVSSSLRTLLPRMWRFVIERFTITKK